MKIKCEKLIATRRKQADELLLGFKEISGWLGNVKAERTGSDKRVLEVKVFPLYVDVTCRIDREGPQGEPREVSVHV